MIKKTKVTLAIILVCMVAVFTLWQGGSSSSLRKLRQQGDIALIANALRTYVAANEGQLPGDWNDLVRTSVVRRIPGREHEIRFSDHASIEDVRRYRVGFGTKAEDLVIKDLMVRDSQGNRVVLVSPVDKLLTHEGYLNSMSCSIVRIMKDTPLSLPKTSSGHDSN